MVKSIRYVKDAFINAGSGVMDFVPTVEKLRPDILVVNEDGGSEEKRRFCEDHGIEYVVLQRVPHEIPGQAGNDENDRYEDYTGIVGWVDGAGEGVAEIADEFGFEEFGGGWESADVECG